MEDKERIAELVAILALIRRSMRRDPQLGRVVCIHDGSALLARIDAALAANVATDAG